jgi:hypothetical protein
VDVVDRITQIVARVSSRMFGGTTLSRNKEWIQSSIDFATDGFIGAQGLKKYPEFLKPIIARFVPLSRISRATLLPQRGPRSPFSKSVRLMVLLRLTYSTGWRRTLGETKKIWPSSPVFS